MKKISFYFSLFLLLACNIKVNAQLWVQKMLDPNATFYDAQTEFNNYWANKPYEKGKGYKQFKRWEWFMEPRVYPTGNKTLASQTWENYQEYLDNNAQARNAATGTNVPQSSTWTAVGPFGAPSGGGAGRLNIIRFVPGSTTNIFTGGPASGLWKTTNGGTSWTTNTDNLATLGVSDIGIDPLSTNTMYLATGDGDAGDSYSIGLLKSTNGGTTWNTTGLTYTTNQQQLVRRVLINPSNTQIIIAGMSGGITRSTNGATSFTATSVTTSIRDMEFKPGDPNTVYACGTRFYRSTDGGVTWTQVTSGLPANTAIDRMAMAVSPADPNTIYVIAGDASSNGFYGLYKSTNSGVSFTQVTVSSPSNLLGWASAGNDTGGQSWYDLAIAVSPTNINEVSVGGVNIWRSTNGGTSFTLYGYWTGTPYTHADQHDLIYDTNGDLWAANDGGIYKRSGSGWIDLTNGMNIAQPYRIGLSTSNASLIIAGHQDNGTNRYNGTWAEVMGGDGMDCFIDRTNNNVMYGEQYNGSLNRSTNGGASWTGITTGLTGNAAWMTPWHQDPSVANTIYVGYQQIFKSTNQGTNWSQTTGSMTGTSTIVEFAIAPSNNQVIYVIKGNTLFKTTNGGGAWTNITGTLPTGSAQMTYITIDPTDPTNAWVTFSGYSSGNKIFVTTNGGTSWTNISTGLPNIPANCSVYQPGSNDGIYVGCDVGIYYRDNTTGSWALYNTGLPNAPVVDLEIYATTLKLRCATYGRGVWEVDCINPGNLPPVALFSSDRQIVCPGNTVNFTDQSSFTPTSWQWTFQGGTPATSTSQNPSVVYNTAGTYSVQLIAINANGDDTLQQTTYITVTGVNSLPLSEGFVSATFPPTNWTTKDANNDGTFWVRSATVGNGSTNSMLFDNYNLNAGGSKDEMQTPKYNFTGYTSVNMTFDVAYARYDVTYSDSLAVLVSTDCGVTFTQVYLKGGTTLATAPDQTASIFAPSGAAQWRNEAVSLNAFIGQPNVMIVFQNRGYWGQALYVDNINITGVTAGAPPTASFTASSNLCTNKTITLTDASTNNPTSWLWTAPGGSLSSTTVQNPTVTYTAAGNYTITLVATNANGSSTPYNLPVTINTSPVATASNTGPFCTTYTVSLSSSGGGTYSWAGPGSFTSTTQNPTRSPATIGMAGTYTVTVTAANGCTATATTAVAVNIKPTSTVTGSNSFCAGSNLVLSGTTSTAGSGTITGYQWNLGGAPISGATSSTYTATAAGTYNLVVSNSNGCTHTSANKVITVNPLPSVTVNSPTICVGATANLSAGGATTYSWSQGGTGTTANVTPSSTTSYTVTGTGSNGCINTAVSTVTVNSLPIVAANAYPSASICNGSPLTLSGSGASTYTWTGGVSNGVAFTPTSSQTYTVTGTDANGCQNTGTVNVVLNALPVVIANVAPSATVCNGDQITLSGSGATSYSWTGGVSDGIAFTTSASQTYTVTGTDANGCQNTAVTSINVNPLPIVSASVSPSDSICSGTAVTLTGLGAVSYAWTGGITDGIAFTPSTSQTYTVTGTDTNNCQNTSTIVVVVDPCVGVNEVSNSNLIGLFPNPSDSKITLTLNGLIEDKCKIEITNDLGQLVLVKEITTKNGRSVEQFDFTSSPKGLYYLRVSSSQGQNIAVRKFVIQ